MKENLFVYGSLMGGVDSPIANYLKGNSQFLGEAYLEGTLYDLGQYPGIVPQAGIGTFVKGHVFQLSDAPSMLPVLDNYEGTSENFVAPTEYIRSKHQILLNEVPLDCWVYQYNYGTEHLKIIESGDYLQYLQENKYYQQFIHSLKDFTRH